MYVQDGLKEHLCAFLDASLLILVSTLRCNILVGRSPTVHSFTVLWQQKRFLTVIWTMSKRHQRYKYIAVFALTIFIHPFVKCG